MPTVQENRPSVVRIYILWHPGFKAGAEWARRLYHWFRLESMEGIPVFFRSENAPGMTMPPAVVERKKEEKKKKRMAPPEAPEEPLNYVIPLVEANMVASPEWRRYVMCLVCGKEAKTCVLLPVAMDRYAYQMPAAVRSLNFIRHEVDKDPNPELLIGQLTEVICRHLREHKRAQTNTRVSVRGRARAARAASAAPVPPPPAKIRIFLSHAKLDGTGVPVKLKEHIQGQTQCEAFYDETDLAFGFNYAPAIQASVSAESAGLIVVQGDNYADRPWCRREVSQFLKPQKDPGIPDARGSGVVVYFVPPVVVVQNMLGVRNARTIPELGHATCVRWTDDPGCERRVVSSLQREILLGLFHRLLAQQIANIIFTANARNRDNPPHQNTLILNRAPDPVMLGRILNSEKALNLKARIRVLHPGYGLTQMEKEALSDATVDEVVLESFAEFNPGAGHKFHQSSRDSGGRKKHEPRKKRFPNQFLAVSAGNAGDIGEWGLGDEHNRELLQRLLKPLFADGMSLLYGGALPEEPVEGKCPPEPWEEPVNFTKLFLNLLLSERDGQADIAAANNDEKINKNKNKSKKDAPPVSAGRPCRLYNLAAWPRSRDVTPQVRAQWSDVCSFIPVSPADAGMPDPPPEPGPEELVDPAPGEKRAAAARLKAEKEFRHRQERLITARCLTAMRKKAVEGVLCQLPDDPLDKPRAKMRNTKTLKPIPVCPAAHLFAGGKIRHSSGIAPGIFEEVLYALEAEKPVFLLGCTRGATGLLARWFLTPPARRPRELTIAFYADKNADFKMTNEAVATLSGLPSHAPPLETAGSVFDRLWEIIKSVPVRGLKAIFKNHIDNQRLLESENYTEVCSLVLEGLKLCIPAPKDYP